MMSQSLFPVLNFVPVSRQHLLPGPQRGHAIAHGVDDSGGFMAENDRVTRLEEEVASLRAEVAGLSRLVEEFKRQFE